MANIIIYPGTFDPITHGHTDLIQRAAKIFDKIIVGIAANPRKEPFFTLTERIKLAEVVLSPYPEVEIAGFSNLLVHFAQEKNAKLILRGLRAVSDFEYEFQLAAMNHKLNPTIETIFMSPSENYMYLSSTLIKDIAFHQGDITPFVHPEVKKAFIDKHCGLRM